MIIVGIIIALAVGLVVVLNRPLAPKLYYNQGEVVKVGNREFVVEGVKLLDGIGCFDERVVGWVVIAPEPRSAFMAVNITMKNTAQGEINSSVMAMWSQGLS